MIVFFAPTIAFTVLLAPLRARSSFASSDGPTGGSFRSAKLRWEAGKRITVDSGE